jgi:hypothetical protein
LTSRGTVDDREAGERVMKTVGHRQEHPVHFHATGESLAQGARFSEAIAGLSRALFIPKGVVRFNSHEAANRHWDMCLAHGMAKLAAGRAR